jgi:hypothetical protein
MKLALLDGNTLSDCALLEVVERPGSEGPNLANDLRSGLADAAGRDHERVDPAIRPKKHKTQLRQLCFLGLSMYPRDDHEAPIASRLAPGRRWQPPHHWGSRQDPGHLTPAHRRPLRCWRSAVRHGGNASTCATIRRRGPTFTYSAFDARPAAESVARARDRGEARPRPRVRSPSSSGELGEHARSEPGGEQAVAGGVGATLERPDRRRPRGAHLTVATIA